MLFALVAFRYVVQGVLVPVLLLVACSRPQDLLLRTQKWHLLSVVDFCRKQADMHCIRCR